MPFCSKVALNKAGEHLKPVLRSRSIASVKRLFARKMIVNGLIGQRNVPPGVFVDSLPILNADGALGLPITLDTGE